MLAVAGLAAGGMFRLKIDYDIVNSLPHNEPAITNALDILANHPIHDQVAIDIMIDGADPDLMAACGQFVEQQLMASGLFQKVGMKEIGDLLPELTLDIVKRLPLMFTEKELADQVQPLLLPEQIDNRVTELYAGLTGMNGIGQSRFIAEDPLGLKDLVMVKMALLAPSKESRIHKGQLLSADGRHLLVTARPATTGTDTSFAREAVIFLDRLAKELTDKYGGSGRKVVMTPVGSYRAALDNELIIKSDVNFATIVSTLGIAILLLFSFPRPLIGLLSLAPAIASTAAAFFVYSFFHPSISIMVLGFGGAIISMTVDHGIVYLLFLDRPHETRGREAAKEVSAVGIMADLTTIGAFASLCFSGFPILEQLGLFTALGAFFSSLFVHYIFPLIFPAMPPGNSRNLPLQQVVNRLSRTGGKGAIAALLLAGVLLFHANPGYNVSLSAMNTMSQETVQAGDLFSKVWGDMSNRIYLMTSAESVAGLEKSGDTLLTMLEQDAEAHVLSSFFAPAMIFPGKERSQANLAAWRSFWGTRSEALRQNLDRAAGKRGFATDAFAPFYALLDPLASPPKSVVIGEKYFSLLGISPKADQTGFVQFLNLIPGPAYNAEHFLERYGEVAKTFDPASFSERLGHLLFTTFSKMLIIIAASTCVLLFFFFYSWPLTLLTLVPIIFAYICTLGTLKLLGHALDIPGLMLSVIIFGLGIDYSIFFVRAYQRYRDPFHPSFGLIRMAAFLTAGAALIGFGVLCFAEHSLLRSAGLTSFFGLLYSLIGAFVVLPPLMEIYYRHQEKTVAPQGDIVARVLHRYHSLEAYPRLFARFKMKFDPLFADLPGLLVGCGQVGTILDIGCGYGVPAAWLLEQYPNAVLHGLEPEGERVRVANLALGARGSVQEGRAPEMPALSSPVDLALMLDMLHYLPDEAVALVLSRIFAALRPDGLLLIRVAIPPQRRPSWLWRLDEARLKLAGVSSWRRSPETCAGLLTQAGFKLEINAVSDSNSELLWLVGRAVKK